MKTRNKSLAPPPGQDEAPPLQPPVASAEEELFAETPGVLRTGNLVADGPRVAEDLVVVSSLKQETHQQGLERGTLTRVSHSDAESEYIYGNKRLGVYEMLKAPCGSGVRRRSKETQERKNDAN